MALSKAKIKKWYWTGKWNNNKKKACPLLHHQQMVMPFAELLSRSRLLPLDALICYLFFFFSAMIYEYKLQSWASWAEVVTTMKGKVLEVLEQAAHRGCGCPVPGGIEGQVGQGPEQSDVVCWQCLAVGNPAYGRGVGTRWSSRSLPTQAILWFYES